MRLLAKMILFLGIIMVNLHSGSCIESDPSISVREAACLMEGQALTSQLLSEANGDYTFCDLKHSLQSLVNWYDRDTSFADTRWFNSDVYSSNINEGPIILLSTAEIWFLILSLIANTQVVWFHLTNVPHPKFTLSLAARICIKIHVLFGITVIVLPVYVFFTSNMVAARVCMFIVCVCDLIFSFSAMYQTPNTPGVRVLTVPAYAAIVILKLFLNCCLFQSLILNPMGGIKSQVSWLWLLWVIHQTYAWMRVWYRLFIVWDICESHQYTFTMYLGGMMCCGGAVGIYAWLVIMAAIFSYSLYLKWRLNQLDEKVRANLFTPADRLVADQLSKNWVETPRGLFTAGNIPDEIAAVVVKILRENRIDYESPSVEKDTPPEVKAEILFATIDVDDNKEISVPEMQLFLINLGLTESASLAKELVKGNVVTIADFLKNKSIVAFSEHTFSQLVTRLRHVNRRDTDRNRLAKFAHSTVVHRRSTFSPKYNICPFAEMWHTAGSNRQLTGSTHIRKESFFPQDSNEDVLASILYPDADDGPSSSVQVAAPKQFAAESDTSEMSMIVQTSREEVAALDEAEPVQKGRRLVSFSEESVKISSIPRSIPRSTDV